MEIIVPKFNTEKKISLVKQEEYAKYSKVANWGRRNPIAFNEQVLGIALMDFQKYILLGSWGTPYVCWLKCRGASKTTLGAIMIMDNMMLVPNYQVFISTNSAKQSIILFKKIEDIAKNRIPSFQTLTDIFLDEVKKNRGNDFNHAPDGHTFSLFNNSRTTTLSSNFNLNRGERGSVFFDETAWQGREQVDATEKFANQDSSFGVGVGENLYKRPKQMPLQLIYSSSAGDVNFPFYERYSLFSKKMFMGDKNYFCCDLNVYDILYNTTLNGDSIKSHITEESVRKAIEEDPELAERELFNKFTTDAGKNAVVSMDTLMKCSYPYKPTFYNDTSQRKFILCYDPARAFDNSILSIFEIIEDSEKGFILRLVNMISLVDIKSEKKTPMGSPKQLQETRKTLLRYNGENALQWENVDLYIDAGAGGGGISAIADPLTYSFTDETGITYKALIDSSHKQFATRLLECSDASNNVHCIEPKAYKSKMFSTLEDYLKQGLIEFPDYDGKEIMILQNEKGEYKDHILTIDERLSLEQCELAKKELLYMQRHDDGQKVTYSLKKEKSNTMHDDRAYTIAMAAYALSKIRKKDVSEKNQENDAYQKNRPFFSSSVSFD